MTQSIKIKYPIINEVFSLAGDVDFLKLLENQKWEYDCIKHVVSTVKPGQIILDVGAWIGPYALLFSKLVTAKGKVYSFEPDANARKILQYNVRKNRLNNIKILDFAVNDVNGYSNLYAFNQWSDSMSNLLKRQGISKEKPIKVNTITLDTFCEKYDVKPDGIKIDVEGAEASVIKGCQNILRKYSPWVIIEFHGMFMTDQECMANWDTLINTAKNITFISGKNSKYSCGERLKSFPDCKYFHVAIQY